MAQAPEVEIMRDRGEPVEVKIKKVNELKDKKELLSLETVAAQIDRKSCRIDLPKPSKKSRSDRELWALGKAAHVRVGWHYLCQKCDKWHQNLAGGYFINSSGAVATCFHVIAKNKDSFREAYLVAVNDQGEIVPIVEVLAANPETDTAILRAKVDRPVTPLPLNVKTYPGDTVLCYSDPLNRSGYFSKGIINRFYYAEKNGKETPRIEVSTDWAPGSSGAAVIDQCGNAIGHVSEISSVSTGGVMQGDGKGVRSKDGARIASSQGPVIVFHCAARAADVLALVEKN
jgi:S1-C subfamily serine protease